MDKEEVYELRITPLVEGGSTHDWLIVESSVGGIIAQGRESSFPAARWKALTWFDSYQGVSLDTQLRVPKDQPPTVKDTQTASNKISR